MQICTLASSSAGNCALLSHNKVRLLLDAGISCRRILSSLQALQVDPESLDGVVITHEHSDHICGLTNLCRKIALPIYAPAGVAEGIREFCPDTAPYLQEIPVGEDIPFRDVSIRAFHTPHDTRESVGYRFTANQRSFALATDLGHISEEVLSALLGAQVVLIEANYDQAALKAGPYPPSLKKRILSDHGHLSNRLCGLLAGRLWKEGAHTILLGHLSKENNRPEWAFETVTRHMKEVGAVPGENCRLLVAPRSNCSEIVEV